MSRPSSSMSHSSSRVHPDLLAKQQEHLMLQRLLEATTKLLSRAEELADSGDVMAEGGAAIASVLANWSSIFRIINDVAPPPPTPNPSSADDSTTTTNEPEEAIVEPLPRLVRLEMREAQDLE
ncbi:hypothetical protein BDY24DRAFT_382481 [Mrakia frigida]|uniref:uncharacterized protein n=1 Tax=Mrakia frigida TaxID=29902 RepID=UPI003FCBF44C